MATNTQDWDASQVRYSMQVCMKNENKLSRVNDLFASMRRGHFRVDLAYLISRIK